MALNTISKKIGVSFFLIGFITLLTIYLLFFNAFKKALIERTIAQLSSINVLKKARVEDYFKTKLRTLDSFIESPLVADVLKFDDSKSISQENFYSTDFNKVLERFEEDHSFRGAVFLNKNYNIIYPNEAKPSSLASTINKIKDTKEFIKYLESARKRLVINEFLNKGISPLVLIASPLYNKENEFLGVILLEKKLSPLEDILHERTGMGETGESYIVGQDFSMRSSSRFYPEKSPYTITVKTTASKASLNGKEGTGIIKDYRGVPVLSVYRNLDIPGLNWVIISEIDLEEAMAPVNRVRNNILIIALVIFVLIILTTLLLSQFISAPIKRLKGIILLLSKGKLPAHKLEIKSRDEIGQMTEAIDKLIEGLKSTSHFAAEIGNGNFTHAFSPLSEEDTLGLSLIQMRDKIKRLQEQEAKLTRQRSFALVEGQENERKRVSRELHDGIAQMLTAAKFRVGALEGQDELQKELKKILDDTIAEVRRVSQNLMPSVLVDFGLKSALESLCNSTGKYTGLKIYFDYFREEGAKEINFKVGVSLYRIVQEALNNIIKHAQATEVIIRLLKDENTITLVVEDNGVGINLEREKENINNENTSSGIKNMRERANLLNGIFEIFRQKPNGTVVKVVIPTKELK